MLLFFFFTKRHIFFFYIAPLLDFYRTGIFYFKIDHVSIIRFKLIFKEVFFSCAVYIRFLKSFLISKLIMYHSIHILKVFGFFTRMSCSIVLFLFCSLKELFNFIVLEFSFFIKKIFSFVDNLDFFFYIITSRENYSLAWKWVSHDLAHMMYVDDLITQLVSYCHCGIMISTNCWTCLFINKYYLLHLLSMFYIKRN